jgi:8-oxo-dGTP pyrophosphatase MutT (NUDIX family)
MKKILDLLASYNGIHESEKLIKKRFIEFVQKNEDCFERHLLVGHITASAFIFDIENNKILLLHHKKLNKWLQPGGHCDGDKDTLSVAIKEVFEETGLMIKNQAQPIFDLDIHMIPENKGIPEHEHFDVRYLLLADSKIPLIQNHETNQLKWVDLSEMENYTTEESLRRMKNKLALV